MFEKVQKFWEDLDVKITVNKRELVLGTAACTLAGLVIGMLCSPRKTITMGSNNGGNIIDKRTVAEEPEEETEE